MTNYADIGLASAHAVVRSLSNLKAGGVFASKRFLPSTNCFCPLDSLGTNIGNIPQYLPVSSILHLIDGWGYLGASLRSFARNDIGTCGHLAYYAELRAAMSFLAANGIITLKKEGYFLDSHGVCNVLYRGDGTHVAVWECLSRLAQQRAGDVMLIDEIVRPGSIQLSDWVDAFTGGRGGSVSQNFQLLSALGMDIQNYRDDRNGRNRFSYSATDLLEKEQYDRVSITANFIWVWQLLEPSSVGFENLEYDLLYFVLHGLKKSCNMSIVDFRSRLDVVLKTLGFSASRDLLRKRLFGRKIPYSDGLGVGGRPANNTYKGLHRRMLFRALLLLSVVTLAVRKMMLRSGVAASDLSWWLSDIQLRRFMWQTDVQGYSYADLWGEEVDFALQSLESYSPRGTESWLRTEAASIDTLSTVEYAMLWGLGL